MRRQPAIVAALVLGWTLGPTFVQAQPRPSITLSLLGGVVKPDAGFADYQWDTRPQATGGAQAVAALGAWGAGLRWTQSSSTQSLGSASSTPEASVRTTAIEAVARRQVVAFGGQSVFLDAAVGRTRLSYDPGHVTMDAGGTPVEVTLAPIEEWSWGGGLGTERALSSSLVGGLEVGYRAFGMDTAHQAGGEVVYERQTFSEWSTRFTLGWRFRT